MNTVDDLCRLIEESLTGPGTEPVEAETPLLVSGLIDSLTIMRIVSKVERRAGIAFPETAVVAANFRTPATLWAAIGEFGTGRSTGERT